MGKTANQRGKLLALQQLLMERTDENHPMVLSEIVAALSDLGISAERKSLYHDIRALQQAGMDIQYRGGAKGGWFVGERPFQLAELKMLVDAVEASRFLTRKKSEELIGKISSLASSFEAKQLRRQVYVDRRVKTMNESIYYNIDKIQEGLQQNRAISFFYFEYNAEKQKVLRRNGARYTVSPKGLLWNHENYYLAALDHEHMELRHYRVDKMLDIQCLHLRQLGEPGGDWFDTAQYSNKLFGMFRGKEAQVKLRFRSDMVGVMLDRFGMDLMLIPDGDEYLSLVADVFISQQFWGWLFGLGDQVELLGPYWAVQEYKDRLRAAMQLHNGFKE